jgi:hypothetical protein
MIQPRIYSIPEKLQTAIAEILKSKFLLSLEDSEYLAKCVERLSEHYIRMPGEKTPWNEDWCQIAYLVYYLPLNEIRARAVIEEGQRLHFFNHLKSLQDFGAGLGSGTYSLPKISKRLHIETSKHAQKLHQLLGGTGQWQSEVEKAMPNSLLSMSYSLTELPTLPAWAYDFHSLMIIEPATQDQGRKLMQIRADLIKEGYSIWAPCTHQGACPLLAQSKTDWCHDRVHFDQPDWFSAIENDLPMKNQTLTFSYLLASKDQPPQHENIARTTGDILNENGKSRQLVCRNENREFLAWMHRNGEPQEIPRGTLIKWPTEFTLKSNEVRVKNPIIPFLN